VLLHLVDSTSPDPVTDFELIEGEIRAYDPRLEDVARVVAVTKADIDGEQAKASAKALSEHLGRPVQVIAAVNGEGTEALAAELMELVKTEREREESAIPEEMPVLRPESQERFSIHRDEEGRYVVEGHRIVTFVEMMDTDMEGSRAEIDRRLSRWGITKALRRAGAQPGDRVVFGTVELEWEAVD
jgi:GTPase